MTAKVFSQPSCWLCRLAANQENYNNDEEKEADRAAADVVIVGQNGREEKVHNVSFVFDGKVFTITFRGTLGDGLGHSNGVKPPPRIMGEHRPL